MLLNLINSNSGTSNYIQNVSNVILSISSNYTVITSNALSLISSNYTTNVSNMLLNLINSNSGSSNYIQNASNVILSISSNYAINTSKDILLNSSNYTQITSNAILLSSSNYASNVILAISSNYIQATSNSLLSTLINNYNTNEKQFPPRLYDNVSNINTTYTPTSGNELFNISPATVYRQTLNLNNHGNYTIYTSTIYNLSLVTTFIHNLFNFNITSATTASWVSGSYLQSDGTYTSSGTSYIKSDFKGDWIIIKLPYKIVLTRFRFYNRATLVVRAPALWKCYGSNDGINFTEIIDASNSSPLVSLTANNYITLGYYEKKILSSTTVPYLYIGWVINKIVGGGDATNVLLDFIQLQIFGKDDITNSYSKTLTTLSDNTLIYDNISTIITSNNTTTSLNLTNRYVRFNYADELYFNSGNYIITFINGTHSINTAPIATTPTIIYTYPILKDINLDTIEPLIWYKFDNNAGFLLDNGSLNNGSLTSSGNVTYNTTLDKYVHGNGCVYFQNSGTNFLTIPNTINLSNINTSTGITFTFWVNIANLFGGTGSAFIFALGQTTGTTVTNYITISINTSNPGNLIFQIGISSTSFNEYTAVSSVSVNTWLNITWTISTTGVWKIYINNSLLNGASSFTRTIPEIPLPISNRTYYINKSLNTAGIYLHMYLDDFRIYGKELSATEVAELYTGRVEIYSKKNIGIGNTNPNSNYILDVNGNANVVGKLVFNKSLIGSPSNITIFGGDGDRIILNPSATNAYPHSIGVGSGMMWFSGPLSTSYNWYSNGINIMNLTSGGQLTVNDEVIAFGGLSDKRLKTNINDLEINCINLINKIKSVEFNWINHYRIPEKKRHTLDHGFIAQDIEELLPNLVNSEGEFKSLKYDKFAPYIIKALQELYIIIQNQQKEINLIKEKINL